MNAMLVLLLLSLLCAIAGFFFFGKSLGVALEMCAVVLFVIGVCLDDEDKSERKFPASEYILDYEIITRGEQVDTVYVLTRK